MRRLSFRDSSFSETDDSFIHFLVESYGPMWIRYALEYFVGKSDGQLRDRSIQVMLRRREIPASDLPAKGAWSEEEDDALRHFVSIHGEGRWRHFSAITGLSRSTQSCKLRWDNYVNPRLKNEPFSEEEDTHILQLVKFGGKSINWSSIARDHFPGRTGQNIQVRWHQLVNNLRKQVLVAKSGSDFNKELSTAGIDRKKVLQLAVTAVDPSSSSQAMEAAVAPYLIQFSPKLKNKTREKEVISIPSSSPTYLLAHSMDEDKVLSPCESARNIWERAERKRERNFLVAAAHGGKKQRWQGEDIGKIGEGDGQVSSVPSYPSDSAAFGVDSCRLHNVPMLFGHQDPFEDNDRLALCLQPPVHASDPLESLTCCCRADLVFKTDVKMHIAAEEPQTEGCSQQKFVQPVSKLVGETTPFDGSICPQNSQAAQTDMVPLVGIIGWIPQDSFYTLNR